MTTWGATTNQIPAPRDHLIGHCHGNLSLSSTPQHLLTAGAMSSDPAAGMY